MRKLLARIITTVIILSRLLYTITGDHGDHIFYIIPANSSDSCCPSEQSCVTLDHFAKNQLPDLKGANFAINLLFLSGHDAHILTVPMHFIKMKQVSVSGVNCKDFKDQVKIQMKTQDVKVTNIQEFDIRNLVIDGGGQQSLIVTNGALDNTDCKLILNNVTMLSTTLQMLSEKYSSSPPQFNIASSLFKASKIEVMSSNLLQSSVISNSMFLSEEQQYTIAICILTDYHLPMRDKGYQTSSPHLLLYNMTIVDLGLQGSPTHSTMLSHILCDKNRLGPSDIYITTGLFMLNIMNCSFRRSYGSALQAQTCPFSQFTMSNTTFQDYTQGALLFTGDFGRCNYYTEPCHHDSQQHQSVLVLFASISL